MTCADVEGRCWKPCRRCRVSGDDRNHRPSRRISCCPREHGRGVRAGRGDGCRWHRARCAPHPRRLPRRASRCPRSKVAPRSSISTGATCPATSPICTTALVACAVPPASIEITVNIEIKNDADEPDFDDARSIAPLVVREALAVAGPHRWLISSFDLAMVDAVVATGAGIATAWLVVDVPAGAVAVAHGARPPRTASVGRCAGPVDHRRVPRGRNRRQHVDVRRPGTHARADRVGRRRHLHERARHRPRRPRRPSEVEAGAQRGNTSRTASCTWANSSRLVSPR